MKVTREFLDSHKTNRGSWTTSQINVLGTCRKGWLSRAIGKEITDEQAADFIRFANRAVASADRRKSQKHSKRSARKLSKVVALEQKLKTGGNWSHVASDAFLFSFEWRRVRMLALKKYGPKCQCCGATPQTGAVMNVDHIKPRKLFPHLALDVDNLQILCHECNHGKGNWDQTDWRQEEVDPEVISMLRDIAKHG